MYKIVEKKNDNAVHGLFDTKKRAERFILEVVPTYIARGLYSNKGLTKDCFKVVEDK